MVVTQFATETTTFGRLKNGKYVSAYFLTFTITIINESSQEHRHAVKQDLKNSTV